MPIPRCREVLGERGFPPAGGWVLSRGSILRHHKCGLHPGGCGLATPLGPVLFLQPPPILAGGLFLSPGGQQKDWDWTVFSSPWIDRLREKQQQCLLGVPDFFCDLAPVKKGEPCLGVGRGGMAVNKCQEEYQVAQCARCWLQRP